MRSKMVSMYDLWCWSCTEFCRNQRLFTISFILHATDAKVNTCVVCTLSGTHKCCYFRGVKVLYILCVLRRFSCREGGVLGSRCTDKTWPVNLVLLDPPENSKIHNWCFLLKLRLSYVSFWCLQWLPSGQSARSEDQWLRCRSHSSFAKDADQHLPSKVRN